MGVMWAARSYRTNNKITIEKGLKNLWHNNQPALLGIVTLLLLKFPSTY
jgi:hypothetical protein